VINRTDITIEFYACSLFGQEEISACEIDSKRLTFKEQVLKEEKKLLDKFADHISSVHSVEVSMTSTA